MKIFVKLFQTKGTNSCKNKDEQIKRVIFDKAKRMKFFPKF